MPILSSQPAAFLLNWFGARNIIGTARESWPDNEAAALERQIDSWSF